MKKITVRDIRNEALKRRYDGGFIIEKKNLILKETNYASNYQEVASLASQNPKEPVITNLNNLDNNSTNNAITIQKTYNGNIGNAEREIANDTTLKNVERAAEANGKDVNVEFVNSKSQQGNTSPTAESKRNRRIIENMKRNSVGFTKLELESLL